MKTIKQKKHRKKFNDNSFVYFVGYHGKTNLDMARVEYITDCLYDILDDYMKMYHEKNGKLYVSI